MTSRDGEDLSLNKGQVLSGLRCHKKLWLEFHGVYPENSKPPAEAEPRKKEGEVTDAYAQRAIGPGLNLAPGKDFSQGAVVERTSAAIARGDSPLFQAGFRGAGASIRTDILQRQGDDWAMIEVKSSKWPEKDRDREKKFELHVPDIAVQAWVARESALPLASSHLMYLNPECRHPDLTNLFTTVEVTTRVEPVVLQLPVAVSAMRSMLRDEMAPDVPIGDQCDDPDECPFYARCHPKLPDHHVSELYFAKKKALELEAAGKTMIADLEESDAPNAPAKRQVRSVKSRTRIVEPGLRAALAKLKTPIAHLDFETVQLAVPRWPGCGPQDMIAVQFSVHHEIVGGTRHIEHLATRGGDPRPALIDALVEACQGAATILAWYAQFEKLRIEELAECFPARRAELMDIHGRIDDLLPIVRDHVYDPEFHGSFSLKKVLPTLVPDLGYSDLKIQDGGAATAAIYRLLFDDAPDSVTEDALRRDLLAYCHRDTEAMVRLMDVLRQLSK